MPAWRRPSRPCDPWHRLPLHHPKPRVSRSHCDVYDQHPLTSDVREFFNPFVEFVQRLERDNPTQDIVVIIPDLVMTHWYEHILHNNRGAFLRTLLRQPVES